MENRANQQKEKDEEEISKENMEYQLIFDLIQNKIENDIQLIHRLANINRNKEIFNAKEYHEEINKASKEQDALKLQRLIKITTLNQLKQYLSEQK